jgi:hypothetical protein
LLFSKIVSPLPPLGGLSLGRALGRSSAVTAQRLILKDLNAWYDWERGFKAKNENFRFFFEPFPNSQSLAGIEACNAGILSNQDLFAPVPLRAL